MPQTTSVTRRRFAQTSLLTAASQSRILGANERIRIGGIGTGNRARYLLTVARKLGCEIAAINDINDARTAAVRKALGADARGYRDFRKLLEDKSLDAVIIGSPDHWHVPMLVAAVEAGKDVYIEKPLTHSPEEGETAIAAVRRTSRVVQVGYQQRSYPHMKEAREFIQSGGLGDITLVQSYWYQNYNRFPLELDTVDLDWKAWLGSAPLRAYEPIRYGRWRWFWDYGGGTLTDLFSHWLDTIHWIMKAETPLSAQAQGGRYVHTDFECPDTLRASFHYPGKFTIGYDSSIAYGYEDGGMIFRGSKATLRLDRSRYEIFTEASILEQRTSRPSASKTVPALRDGTVDHMQNFLDCVKSRQQPNSDVVSAANSANVSHLGNRAYRTGKLLWTSRQAGVWRPLANGVDLKGWIVDTPGLWSVRDGVIIGRHGGLKYNDFLRTEEHFEDFELKLRFRLLNNQGNSGVQFRSIPVPDSHEVFGFQADIGQQYWGALYDESRRKKVLAGPPKELQEGIDKNAWHEYRIRAEGSLIELRLDGIRTVHYMEEDPGILKRGFIALQVHSGPGIEVHFRDLEIREL
ncbi:MAG: DUF1080 domain-containing protein [Acidobacteria bacterium]|nr:DUF1080 domain-containing protein [Acidobacteriota bacterium]